MKKCEMGVKRVRVRKLFSEELTHQDIDTKAKLKIQLALKDRVIGGEAVFHSGRIA